MRILFFSLGVFLFSATVHGQVPLTCDGLLQIVNAVHSGSIKGADKYPGSSDKYKILESAIKVEGQSDAFVFVSSLGDLPTVSAHYAVFSGSKSDAKEKWEMLTAMLKNCTWSGWRQENKHEKKDFYPIATGEDKKPGYKIVAVSYSKEKSKPGNSWSVNLYIEETFATLSGY